MYQPIIGTLGFVLSLDQTKVLMVYRNKRLDDHQFGKYNGLGGKLEKDEDILTGMKREIFEEAGIECEKICLRGSVNWPGFGPNGEHWLGFVFLITKYKGDVFDSNKEGDLIWIEKEKILECELWEGDKYFIPLVFDGDPRIFHAYLPYLNGKPISWSYTRS